MHRVGIASSAYTMSDAETERSTSEMAFDVATRALKDAGLSKDDVGLVVSASSDVLEGRPFGFVAALEALGAWPPKAECHLDMDGAFAAWFAWIKILAGEADAALVVAWSKCSEASVEAVTNTQLDPFTLAPLGLGRTATAALQADAWLARTQSTPEALDAFARACDDDREVAAPLWTRHTPRTKDGACAIVLKADARPSIAGADHRAEPGALGHRELGWSPSAALAAENARIMAGWDDAESYELSAIYAHEEPILREAMRIGDGARVRTRIDEDPMMATGLISLARAAESVGESGRRAIAHASSGHALQQNLVFAIEP